MKIVKQLFILGSFLISHFAFSQNCAKPLPTTFQIGAGLSGLTDYDQSRPFNDVFKANRGLSADVFSPYNFIQPTTDALGWPTQDFGAVVMVGMAANMAGTYKIRFNGQATISPVASDFVVQNQIYVAATNTTTADLVYPTPFGTGQQMMIGFTNTQFSPTVAGLKNVQIMRPGQNFNAPTFTQQFIDHNARFKNTRFMDFHNTNNNLDSLWSDRTLPTDPTQAGEPRAATHGASWELVIELANKLNHDIWINVPHKADDNYVLQLATLLKNTLNSNIIIHVEYSNEVWNWQFEQAGWNYQQAQIEAAQPGSPLNFDNANDENTFTMRRYAKRTKEISDIFKTTFGASAINNRIRVVYATQIAWLEYTGRGLEFINDFYGAPSQYFYACAGAPYFNTQAIDASNPNATTTQVLNAMQTDVNTVFGSYSNYMDAWVSRAKFFGLKFLGYEGGPDTFGPENIAAKRNASKNVRMKHISRDYLKKWFNYGADGQFNWFVSGAGDWTTQYGTWSLTENYEYSNKLAAIDKVLADAVTPALAGNVIPGNLDPRRSVEFGTDWAQNPDFSPGWQPFFDYLLRVPRGNAGNYAITFETKSYNSGDSFQVWVDNALCGTVSVPNSGDIFQTTIAVNAIGLDEGLHTLRLKWNPNGGNFNIRKIIFGKLSNCAGSVSCNLPTGWTKQDIGAPVMKGDACHDSGTFHVSGGGTDVAGTSDKFQFIGKTLTGNATIIARITGQSFTNEQAKAGIMIRQNLNANSQNAFVFLSPNQSASFSRRATAGGSTSKTSKTYFQAGTFLKLVRSGNVFQGFVSENGTTWTLISTQTISMTGAVQIGLAVTSKDNFVVGTGVFDQVTITNIASLSAEKVEFESSNETEIAKNRSQIEPSSGNIFPNPNSGKFSFNWTAERENDGVLSIFNASGASVYSMQMPTLAGENQAEISLPSLPNGLYLLRLQTNEGSVTRKFLLHQN